MSSQRRSSSTGSSGASADAATLARSLLARDLAALVRVEVDGREPRRQVGQVDARILQVADERLVPQPDQHATDVEDHVADHVVRLPAESEEEDQEPDHVSERDVPAATRSHAPTDRASGNSVVIATPADDPNQIMEPPNPTA